MTDERINELFEKFILEISAEKFRFFTEVQKWKINGGSLKTATNICKQFLGIHGGNSLLNLDHQVITEIYKKIEIDQIDIHLFDPLLLDMEGFYTKYFEQFLTKYGMK